MKRRHVHVAVHDLAQRTRFPTPAAVSKAACGAPL